MSPIQNPARNAAPPLRFVPVDPGNADDLDALFSRGYPRSCQCAFVRLSNADWNRASREQKRAVHHDAIAAAATERRAAGIIAYLDDGAESTPVGWVSFDERSSYDRLNSSRLLAPVDDRPVWSIVCFVVAAPYRRHGVAGRLLEAAVHYARSKGVELLESYPVDPAPGRRVSSDDLWRGTVGLFARAGFQTVEVRRRSSPRPRPIMRLAVSP